MASRSARVALQAVLLFIFLVVVALLAGLGILQSDRLSRLAALALEELVEESTGENAVIGAVDIRPLARKAVVEGVLLSSRDDPGRTIASVEKASVKVGLEQWRPVLREVVVERPTLDLSLHDGKLDAFQNMPRGERNTPLPAELPWEVLQVRDGGITFTTGEQKVLIAGLNVEHQGKGPLSMELGQLSVDVGLGWDAIQNVTVVGAHATPQQVSIPQLFLPFTGASITAGGHLRPGETIDVHASIETTLQHWAPLINKVDPEGTTFVDLHIRGPLSQPVIGGAALVEQPSVSLIGASGAQRHYTLGTTTLVFSVEDRLLQLDPLVMQWASGLTEVRGQLDLDTQLIQASVFAEELAFAELMPALGAAPNPWVGFDADVEIQVAGTLSPLQLSGSFDFAVLDLVVQNGPVAESGHDLVFFAPRADAHGQLRLDDRRLVLEAWQAGTPNTRGYVKADIGLRPHGPLDLELDMAVDYSELAPLGGIEMSGTGTVEGQVLGSFQELTLRGRAFATNFEAFSTAFADTVETPIESDFRVLSFPGFKAKKGHTTYAGNLDIDFPNDAAIDLQMLIERGQLADILAMWLDIEGVDAYIPGGSLELNGTVNALDGEARLGFQDIDLFGERFERGHARGFMDGGRFTLDDMQIHRGTNEVLIARGTVAEQWKSHFEIVSGGLRLETATHLAEQSPRISGHVFMDAVIDGTLFDPAPRGRIAVRDGRLFGRGIDDSLVYFDTNEGVMSFEGGALGDTLGVAGTIGLWGEQPYSVVADLDDVPLHVLFPEGVNGGAIDARVSGGVDLTGAFGEAPIPVDIVAELNRVGVEWQGHRLVSTQPWSYQQHGHDIEMSGINLQGGKTVLAGSARFDADGPVVLNGQADLDLDLLRVVVPGLDLAQGTGKVIMTLQQGSPSINFDASNAKLAGDWFPATLEAVDVELRATPERITLARTQGRFGGGRFGFGGVIYTEGFVPKRYDLSGTATDATLQYFDALPPMRGDGVLSFRGPATSPLLSGAIAIDRMVFDERITWEEWVVELAEERLVGLSSERGSKLFDMNIDVVADRSIRARNNLADLVASAELRVVGDTERPGLIGDVRAEPGGEVLFKEREFDLLRGEIRFIEPYSYDPDLDFAMSTSVRTREQEYDIDYFVTGPFSDWRTTATSNPALSQADVNAVLLFGMTGEEFERYGGIASAMALEGGGLLATKVASDLGIAREVDEGIFQLIPQSEKWVKPDRIDLQTGVSERGLGAVTSELRLVVEKDYTEDTTLIVERNLNRSNDYYVGLEQRIARRLFATGYWASQEIGRDVSDLGAAGMEFNFRWELD